MVSVVKFHLKAVKFSLAWSIPIAIDGRIVIRYDSYRTKHAYGFYKRPYYELPLLPSLFVDINLSTCIQICLSWSPILMLLLGYDLN